MITAPTRFQAAVPRDQLDESLDADAFRAAFRMHPAGVSVITTDGEDGPAAMTISSLSSVSAEPPLVVFSLSAHSYATAAFLRADTVIVHLLAADQLWLAQLGATGGVDRFADHSRWQRLPTGEPVFSEAYSWLRGRVVHRLDAGSSVVCVAHIVQASAPAGTADAVGDAAPLVYHSRTWHQLDSRSVI